MEYNKRWDENKKNPMAPSEIEPATFLLVAQYLNQTRHRHSEGYITAICKVASPSIVWK